MSANQNCVLIGTGMVADTHVAAITDAKHVTLLGVMGRDQAKTSAFARKAADTVGHSVRTYANIEELTADTTVDFVIVATPPNARMSLVKALAASSIPILLEKPIERTLDAARTIVELCEARSVPLGVIFQHRARAASQALKSCIENGELGDIYAAEVRVPWWRDQSYYDDPGRGTYGRDGGGVMISQAIHTLDLLIWLIGPMRRVQAVMHRTSAHTLEAEDWASALFETEKACVGTLTATTAAYPGNAESITLYGTEATAHLCAGKARLQFRDEHTVKYGNEAATGGGADPMAFTHAWHQSVIEAFAASLTAPSRPLATGRDALHAHAMISAMERAANSGSWVEVDKK